MRREWCGRYLDLKGRKMDRGRKLHNDDLHSLYTSTNIVRVIKSRRLRWIQWRDFVNTVMNLRVP
jgi:hypothetical protein